MDHQVKFKTIDQLTFNRMGRSNCRMVTIINFNSGELVYGPDVSGKKVHTWEKRIEVYRCPREGPWFLVFLFKVHYNVYKKGRSGKPKLVDTYDEYYLLHLSI